MTLKDVVLTKELINGEAALLYEGGRLNVGPNAHINQIYGKQTFIHHYRYYCITVATYTWCERTL
jgi:hypothetical protein